MCIISLFNFQAPQNANDSFILGATNQSQRVLLSSLGTASNLLLHVEGPHRLWVQKVPVFYYSLRMLDQTNPHEDGNNPPL